MVERSIIEDQDPKMVKIYYCQCGRTVEMVAVLEHANTDKRTKKEFKEAEKWGRKVEIIPLAEFKTKLFMCAGVVDCPDERTLRYYPQGFKTK